MFQIEGFRQLPQRSEKLREYSIPGFKDPIYLRECIGDHSIFWQCLVRGQYDFSHFPQAKRLYEAYDLLVLKKRTPLVIDCGGNIGLSALWFAKEFPDAIIHVVEPDPSNIEVLKLNTSMYGDRITILRGGVWNEPGYLEIINPNSGPSTFRVQQSTHADTADAIRCYTINEICTLANTTDPLIVKIDIEGAQKNLFTDNTEWVNRATLITLELDDWLLPWEGTSRSFFKCLSQYPFDYLLGGESIFCFRDGTQAKTTR